MKYEVSPTSLVQILKKRGLFFFFIIGGLVIFRFYPGFEEETLLLLNESKLQYPTSFCETKYWCTVKLDGKIFL